MLAKSFAMLLFAWTLASASFGQAIPITAKMHQTDDLLRYGKTVKTHVREVIFLRSSSGSELRQTVQYDGKTPPYKMGLASLWDNDEHLLYTVDYKSRNAYIQRLPSMPVSESSNNRQTAQTLGDTQVAGFDCKLYPVSHRSPTGVETVVGTRCHSEQYNLDLRIEYTMPTQSADGTIEHMVLEMYDIEVGTEPDPKMFNLQHNFTIYKPESQK
ncbi:MAG: hypothetical protein ACRD4S_09580 [Candidatus Acidiferrales bacterium]